MAVAICYLHLNFTQVSKCSGKLDFMAPNDGQYCSKLQKAAPESFDCMQQFIGKTGRRDFANSVLLTVLAYN